MDSTWLLIPVALSAIGANEVLARRAQDAKRRRVHRRASTLGVITFVLLVVVCVMDALD